MQTLPISGPKEKGLEHVGQLPREGSTGKTGCTLAGRLKRTSESHPWFVTVLDWPLHLLSRDNELVKQSNTVHDMQKEAPINNKLPSTRDILSRSLHPPTG